MGKHFRKEKEDFAKWYEQKYRQRPDREREGMKRSTWLEWWLGGEIIIGTSFNPVNIY